MEGWGDRLALKCLLSRHRNPCGRDDNRAPGFRCRNPRCPDIPLVAGAIRPGWPGTAGGDGAAGPGRGSGQGRGSLPGERSRPPGVVGRVDPGGTTRPTCDYSKVANDTT